MVMIMYVTTNGVTKEVPSDPITLKIIYDENKQAVGFIVNGGITYMFVRNLQGDVIALVDDQGETVLEYSYDPWGKLEYHLANGMDEETAMILTAYCPLTYRGYNYDFSTGLYYLQSRYYNPEWGRFLNIDIYLETGHGVTGANVFAYCDSNPVNKNDPMGTFSKEDHYRYTHTFALNYFSKKYADIMAQGSLMVDSLYPPGKITNKYNQSFHFNVNNEGETDSRDLRTSELCEKAWYYVEEAQRYKTVNIEIYNNHMEEAFYLFGQALHPQQDKISHSGDTGNIKIGIGNFSFRMHLLDDDNVNGLYYDPTFGVWVRKEDWAMLTTWFAILVIYSGLNNRGVKL